MSHVDSNGLLSWILKLMFVAGSLLYYFWEFASWFTKYRCGRGSGCPAMPAMVTVFF